MKLDFILITVIMGTLEDKVDSTLEDKIVSI